MKNVKSTSIFFKLLVLIFLGLQNFVFSQAPLKENDSLKALIGKDFKKEENKISASQQYYVDNQNSRKQKIIFSQIDEEVQNASLILKKGIDYKEFTKELDGITKIKTAAVDYEITNSKGFQSSRNLTLTSVMLNEVLLRTTEQIEKIKKNSEQLSQSQYKIDSLIIRDELFLTPKDPQSKKLYLLRYNQVTKDVEGLNKRFKTALDSINALEINANKFKFELQDNIITVDKLRKNLNDNSYSENQNLFDAKTFKNSMSEAFFASIMKEVILSVYYITNHKMVFLLILLSIIAIFSYLKILKKKYVQAGLYDDFKYPIQIFNHPILTSIIISVTVLQFFFPNPPFALVAFLWTVLLICLALIARRTSSKIQKRIWRIYGFFALFGFFLNNILYSSQTEVYLLLFIAVAMIAFTVFLLKKYKNEFHPPMPFILKAVVAIEALAFIFLYSGDYNFGKDLVLIGVFTVFLSYLLMTTLYKILDIIKFSDYLKEPEDGEEKEINLNAYEVHEIYGFRYVLIGLAWFVLVFRSAYWYQELLGPLSHAIAQEQTIGSFTFTYSNILLFFLVIVISSLISRIVSFLSTGSRGTDAGTKNQIGSWMLLIRIGIMTLGVIFAFIISGFPLDKITIILSALGVGIGLGLQTITNNLVSGLIIAFEKPINVGDIIEVGGQLGKMKSMGIRSSVITTFDGADVIIPNGELLNQNLTNWTLGSSRRRFEIKLGVAYGTDLQKTKQILKDILEAHSGILDVPEPMIWVVNFGDNSIDFSIKYWVSHFGVGNDVLSDILMAIDQKFKENNIEIPFPQRDIHIIGDTTHLNINEGLPS